MGLPEVRPQLRITGIIILTPVHFTNVTPEMLVFQMKEQSLRIEEPLLAELA